MNVKSWPGFQTMGMCLSLCCGLNADGRADVIGIAVFPESVELTNFTDRQTMIVQANYADGRTVDVTSEAQYVVARAEIARCKDGALYPLGDGETELRVSFGQREVVVPVVVRDAQRIPAVSFRLDVMPVFMKAGCNRGSCHGSSRGQGGFRLSVFGFDPSGDHYRLTRAFLGRRINLALPAESLVLEKPLGEVSHGGGERFSKDSHLYATLLRWIEAGAPQDTAQVAGPVALEIFPKEVFLTAAGAGSAEAPVVASEQDAIVATRGESRQQRLVVRATYADGTDRDVTAVSVFSSNNETTATVSERGVITPVKRGESFVLARFDTFSVGVPIVVVPQNQSFQYPDVVQVNYIDSFIDRKLKKLQVVPAEICTDEVFLRRVYLDMIGQLPSIGEYHNFLSSKHARKREKLVDTLLGRPEFTDIWVMKWAELLQVHRIKGGFFQWLTTQFNQNVPIGDMVRELLTAEGGFFRDPPVQYFRYSDDPPKMAENVAQVFMGTRIQCARCHNHPFDRWTMDDYYGFAAFFSQLGSKRSWEDTREKIVFDQRSGEIHHPNDGRVVAPKFLGGEKPEIGERDRRAVLAAWLTSRDNPYFAVNLANLAWNHYFGRGLVEPVDDFRVSNPPSHPALLETLAAKLIEYDYDFRKLIRDICRSRTYQLSTAGNGEGGDGSREFSRAALRRLRAEVLHDCLCQVTESPSRFSGFPLGTRAVTLPVASMTNYFLQTFGRASRETVCSCEVDLDASLSQSLHLINGETTWGKIEEGRVIPRLMVQGENTREMIEALFIRCLTRMPTALEMAHLEEQVSASENHTQVLEEIFWALLNSKEFLFNH